jgi:large subunit ribosomal protein L9
MEAKMQVILMESLEGKGVAGDVIKVADGYARNYLLPKSIAILATDSNIKTLEHRRAKLAEKKAQDREAAEAIHAKIDSQSITFEAKSGDSGRLFGSITSQDVADAIHEHFGVFIDKRRIADGTPIKSVGVHPVTVKIFQDVNAVMRILVGTPEEIEAAEEAARRAVEKAAARAAAEAEAAARAEEEARIAAEIADAESDDPDYEERFDAYSGGGAYGSYGADDAADIADADVAAEEAADGGLDSEATGFVENISGNVSAADAVGVADAGDDAGAADVADDADDAFGTAAVADADDAADTAPDASADADATADADADTTADADAGITATADTDADATADTDTAKETTEEE